MKYFWGDRKGGKVFHQGGGRKYNNEIKRQKQTNMNQINKDIGNFKEEIKPVI